MNAHPFKGHEKKMYHLFYSNSMKTIIQCNAHESYKLPGCVTLTCRVCFRLPRSESLLPPQRARYILAFLWTFNVAISSPVLVWNRPLQGRCNKRVLYPIHLYAVLMPPVTVAILVTTVLYARLFCVAWRHRHAIRALELSTAAASHGYVAVAKKEAKLTKTGGIIIGLLYLSWVPYIVGNVLLGEHDDVVSIGIRQAVFLMLSASSMINPVVYQWRIPEFHMAFRKLMPCFRATHSPVDST